MWYLLLYIWYPSVPVCVCCSSVGQVLTQSILLPFNSYISFSTRWRNSFLSYSVSTDIYVDTNGLVSESICQQWVFFSSIVIEIMTSLALYGFVSYNSVIQCSSQCLTARHQSNSPVSLNKGNPLTSGQECVLCS